MTKEELEKIINEEKRILEEQIFKLKHDSDAKIQKLMNEYAIEHARYKIGDILRCNDRYITVDEIRGAYSKFDKLFYAIYIGPELTKQLKPRKDGTRLPLYDDGREIIKI